MVEQAGGIACIELPDLPEIDTLRNNLKRSLPWSAEKDTNAPFL